MRALRVGLVVFVVGVLGAGCATVGSSAGPAVPPSVVTASPGPVGPTGVVLPPRPRDVPVDGVDPCSLLTEAQRADLGLDAEPRFDSGLSGLYGGEVPLCAVGGFTPRSIAVAVFLVSTAGIERWTAGEVAADLSPVDVAGFPGLRAVPTRFTDYCSVIIDVAPGQLVDVQFRSAGERPPIPQDRLCADAEVAAGAVMETLSAR